MAYTQTKSRDQNTRTTDEEPRTVVASHRILTTYAKGRLPAWLERVDLMEDYDAAFDRVKHQRSSSARRFARDVTWAWRLFRRSRNYDAVVTGSDRMSRMFAVAQRILRRRPVPVIYIDWICDVPAGSLWNRFHRSTLRQAAMAGSLALVQGRAEVEAYSRALGVPASKFLFLPYHFTVYSNRVDPVEGDYIFAGGDGNRDYRTLIEAVRGLPYHVVIAAFQRGHFQGVDVPQNVEIVTLAETEYLRTMAGSALVVVPILPGLAHPGGQQTWLNAMSMGKATIVAEDRSACDYINHGSTGWLVNPGSPNALREAICRLMEEDELRRTIGANAAQAASEYSPERFIEGVLAVTAMCIKAPR